MQVGEVRIAEDKDFDKLKLYIDCNDGWRVDYKRATLKVWARNTKATAYKMIKVKSIFNDVKPSLLYDVLHDPEYRKVWDMYMIDSYDIGHLNVNNDVGYYSVRSPSTFKNRDFVLQRSWLDTGNEYMIINHSVFHESAPPKKGFIRAISYLTGFLIRPSGNGCEMGYVTQCDPKGLLPSWLVNKVIQVSIPTLVKQIYKACLSYETWKEKHNPGWKPWIFPDQITSPRILSNEFLREDMNKSNESIDSIGSESNFKDLDYVEEKL
ncbi:hypothetical protein CHUAL_010231 [Chamberlinius hualienensis]